MKPDSPGVMTSLWRLAFFLVFGAAILPADPIISFQVSSLGMQNGTPLFQETFTLSDVALQNNFELDINFDPTVYATLSNGVATSDFNVLLFQPNEPPGEPGVYSALALVDNPSLNGTFSVDFTTLGGDAPPPCGGLTGNACPQFFIYDDSNFNSPNGGLVFQGSMAPALVGAPEPVGFGLAAAGLALILGLEMRSRQRLHAAQVISRKY